MFPNVRIKQDESRLVACCGLPPPHVGNNYFLHDGWSFLPQTTQKLWTFCQQRPRKCERKTHQPQQ